MRILLINYRYFISGGPERYLFNLASLLESKGHQVIPFSINYVKNVKTEYNRYFVSPLSGSDEVYFRDHTWTVKSLRKTLERLFYSKEVYSKLTYLIEHEKPDFAIVLAYLRKLSPSVLCALDINKIPFAVRLSDFGMICPNGHLVRDGIICELCIKGSLINSLRFKCIQNSYSASFINYISIKYYRKKKYFNTIKYFIIPSVFMKNKMIEAGWNESRLLHIPTFVYPEGKMNGENKKRNIIYVGRLEYLKGIHVLLEAVRILIQEHKIDNIPVMIVGGGSDEYVRLLKQMVEKYSLLNVKFVGNIEKERLYDLLKESLISVTPSIWYDNLPNSLLESLACGTPVIAPNHGSFPEVIRNYETGLLFTPGSPEDLASKIKYMVENIDICLRMGNKGIEYVREFHSPEKHYSNILEVYKKINSLLNVPKIER